MYQQKQDTDEDLNFCLIMSVILLFYQLILDYKYPRTNLKYIYKQDALGARIIVLQNSQEPNPVADNCIPF